MEKNNKDAMWKYVWDVLYCKDMFYDGRTAYTPDGVTRALPTSDEIACQVPNPCGWNTGMENGAISVGLIFDALTQMYKATGERHPYFDRLIASARKLSTVSGKRGFLARTVAPDGKSFFADSSRDQYTHMVYGICQFLDSKAATKEERAELTDYIVSYAEYAFHCARPENDYRLCRADGWKGLVSGVWGQLGSHEFLRLPMFYIAAWHLSGEGHWFEKYRALRDEAIERSQLDMPCWEQHLDILTQMQCSVRLCFDYDSDEGSRREYRKLGERITELSLKRIREKKMAETIEAAAENGRKFDTLRPDWRDCPMQYLHRETKLIGSRQPYFVPNLGQAYEQDLWDLRELAAGIVNIAISPDAGEVPLWLEQTFEKSLACVNFERHATEAPIMMLDAYWRLRAKE